MIEAKQTDILSNIVIPKRKLFLFTPTNLFLLISLLFSIVPLLFWGQGLLIHLDKPRIYIPSNLFVYSLSIIFFIYWLAYKLSKKFLKNEFLIWVHFWITFIGILYFFITNIWFLKMNEPDKMKAFFLEAILNNRIREIKLFSWKGIVFLSGQLMYPVNLFWGIFKKNGV